MSADRGMVRRTFAALVHDQVPSAQVVYAYQPGDFGGQSPAVVIGSAGSRRERMTLRGGRTTAYLDVYVFVLAAQPDSAYTQADSEDALDAVERELAALLLDMPIQQIGWQAIDYADRSTCDFVLVDGREYKRERIPIAINLYS